MSNGTLYMTINGWTKERMAATILANSYDERSTSEDSGECVYLNENGNRCAVGCFFTDEMAADWDAGFEGAPVSGLRKHLAGFHEAMPLDDDGMRSLQGVHDGHGGAGLHGALMGWIDENVVDVE